jgi:hypothetical protein
MSVRVSMVAKGALAGLLASTVIALLIFIAELIIGYPNGIFYTVISDALSIDTIIGYNSTLIGFLLHLIAGTVIGVIASIPFSNMLSLLALNLERCILYGTILGIVIWVTVFLPISYMLIIPLLNTHEYELLDRNGSMITSDDLKEQFNRIVYSAIGFHIQYGIIYSIVLFMLMRSIVKHREVQDLI